MVVQELFCILGCSIGQLPEWEGEMRLWLTCSFSLLVHAYLFCETRYFRVDVCHLEPSVKQLYGNSLWVGYVVFFCIMPCISNDQM